MPHCELKANGWSLYPALYIWNDNAINYASKGSARPPLSLAEARQGLLDAVAAAREAEEGLRAVMKDVVCR